MTRAEASSCAEAGVSLVEVLTALAIIAVLTSAVVVYWTGGVSPARAAADRLAVRMTEAREHTLVTGETLGFAADFDGSGWRFFRVQDGVWAVVDDHPGLRPERLGRDLRLYITDGALPRRSDNSESLAPEILFDPAGFDAPFDYELRGLDDRVLIRRVDSGAVVVEPVTATRAEPA